MLAFSEKCEMIITFVLFYDCIIRTMITAVFNNIPIKDLTNVSIILIQTIISEINDGIEGTEVKPGIIGEIGTSWPITEVEKRSLQASAIAQTQTQTPVMIHPGADSQAPFKVLRIFQEAGGDIKRTVMAHLDRTIPRNDQLLTELANTGVFLEYDFFGSEISYMSPYMSDAQRIDKIIYLIGEGHTDQILISHDIHACHQLSKYGGIGFTHIFDYAVPKMLQKGITQNDIDKMLLFTPKAWLTYC